MKTERAQVALRRALRRLKEGQGELARRRARTRVATAIRRLKRAIDEEYPHTGARKPRTRRTPTQRVQALEKKGWKRLPPDLTLRYRIAELGIRSVRVGPSTFVPGWVHTVGILRREALNKVKNMTPKQRRIFVTALQLEHGPPPSEPAIRVIVMPAQKMP